jgi:hypothetical protein
MARPFTVAATFSEVARLHPVIDNNKRVSRSAGGTIRTIRVMQPFYRNASADRRGCSMRPREVPQP